LLNVLVDTEDTGDDLEKIHARERGTTGKAIVDKSGATGNGEEAASSSGSGSFLRTTLSLSL
jgi:hypothetical protein